MPSSICFFRRCILALVTNCAHLADRFAVVLPEVGDRLVIRRKTAQQPHHLDIAQRLALQPPARLHAIEVAVDIKLQQDRGMVARSARRPSELETKIRKIKPLDERIDQTNRVLVVDPAFQMIRKKHPPDLARGPDRLRQQPTTEPKKGISQLVDLQRALPQSQESGR